MKAKEALKLLNVTRQTLYNYVKEGKVKTTQLHNGCYEYDDDSIYDLINNGVMRKNYIYARVSTKSQKKSLENQIDLLKNYCFQNGIVVNGIYKDIASGISFENRKAFFEMLDDILSKKVKYVIITYKDRLSRVGFDLFKHLFSKFGCEIIIISDIGSEKLDSEEIFEEIISLLHCYSMKLYSKRKEDKIKKILKEDE